jgi:hypothetical protein
LSGPEIEPLLRKVNVELQKILIWFWANRMAANIGKTKYIIFKPKNKTLHLNPGEGLFFNNNDINAPQDPTKIHSVDRIYNDNPNEHDRKYKLLGVLFDENLSF